MGLQQQEVIMRRGYDIGIGVVGATGSPVAAGAKGDITPPAIGPGGSGSYLFRRIESTAELEQELGISVEASGGVGLFSASGSFDFAKSCKVQASSLVLLVRAEENFAFEQMDVPKLTEPASDLVEAGNMADFALQFGEYFIRGIATGGRFFGLIRIDTNSEQSKTVLDTALSASYGINFDVNARVTVQTAMQNTNAKVEVFVRHEGGRVTTRPRSVGNPTALVSELFQALDEWTATVRQEPKAYSVTLAPYIVALGPQPPNMAELQNQSDVLIRCAKLRSQTLDKLNLIEYILDPNHRGEFAIVNPPFGPDLPALQAALAADLDVIADAASFALNNIKKACEPEVFMEEIRGVTDFRFTPIPLDLPQHTGGNPVVPNFIGLSLDEASRLAESARVIIQAGVDGGDEISARCYRQVPDAGTQVRPPELLPPGGGEDVVFVHFLSPGVLSARPTRRSPTND